MRMGMNIALAKVAMTLLLLLALPAAASDYTLGVFGNANEDDTINMQDVTYTELIILEYRDKTDLADGKYDGKINMQDVTQIELVILGKEKELTLLDLADRVVTVNKPIERVFVYCGGSEDELEAIRVFGIQDKVVGIATRKGLEAYFPELSKLPNVERQPLDYEAILSLNPDVMIVKYPSVAVEAAKKLPGVTVVTVSACYKPEIPKGMTTLGYIFDKEDEAAHYLNDFVDEHLDLIKARTEVLSEEERPKVYEESYSKPYTVHPQGLVEAAGGRDIFADTGRGTVDPEAVIARNPDIILKKMWQTDSGYGVDDATKAKAIRDEIMSRSELANVNAVKNGRVYVIYGLMCYGLQQPIPIAYYAKWFHPELFEDMDPQAIHQEYLTEFQGLDYDLDEHGVFVYPRLEAS